MPAGLQVQTWFNQGLAGGGFEALAPGTSDSATFFNVPIGSAAFLGEIWGVDDASPCELSLKATRFHDQLFGIRVALPDGSALAPPNRASCVSPAGIDQPIFPSDILQVETSGTAGDNVNATLVLYYPDIPGISARLATAGYVKGNSGNVVGINTALTPGAGDWGASVALNASDNRLHANKDYAVLGFTAQGPLSAVAIQGIDTGNMRVGGPVLADPEHDAYLFVDLAEKFNLPLVPIINSNNAGNILLQAADPAAGATIVDVLLVELKSNFGG